MEPTMTIATKDAFAALNQMFKVRGSGSCQLVGLSCGVLMVRHRIPKHAGLRSHQPACHLQGSLPLEHGSLPPNPYAEPTLSFGRGGGLGGSGSSSLPIVVGGSGASGSGCCEPTMTISTKAAFDAINQMFKVWVGGGAAEVVPCWQARMACLCHAGCSSSACMAAVHLPCLQLAAPTNQSSVPLPGSPAGCAARRAWRCSAAHSPWPCLRRPHSHHLHKGCI